MAKETTLKVVKSVKTLEMRDLSLDMAAKVFEILNNGNLEIVTLYGNPYILTNVEPKDLVYPSGWYYNYGFFRAFHVENEFIELYDRSGISWSKKASYKAF